MIVLDTSNLIESLSDIINKVDSVCCGSIGFVVIIVGIVLYVYISKKRKK
jgi:hypothetical protein